jgi:bile acid:Na+ symporter, BASS family
MIAGRAEVPPVIRWLGNRYVVLILALILGLLLPGVARALRTLVSPAIILIITVSTLRTPSSIFLPLRKTLRPFLLGIVLNYVVLSGAILLIGHFASPNEATWSGLVLVAAAPPGFAVVPFAHLLGGDVTLSVIGSLGGYLATLAIAPILATFLVGGATIGPLRLLRVIAELVVAPLILSRILRRTGITDRLDPWIGGIINWGFFLVLFIVVGLNQSAFLHEPVLVAQIAAVAVACTFALGGLVHLLGRRLLIARSLRTSHALLGTIKNSGWATATALVLFGQEASIPGAVWSVVTVLYLLGLSLLAGRRPAGSGA